MSKHFDAKQSTKYKGHQRLSNEDIERYIRNGRDPNRFRRDFNVHWAYQHAEGKAAAKFTTIQQIEKGDPTDPFPTRKS